MRAVDLTTAGLFVLLAAVVISDALRVGIGWGEEGPRSGFFPFWLAVLLALFSGAIFMQAWRRTSPKPFVTRAQLIPVLKVLVPMAGFIVVIDPPGPPDGLGLYVAAALYIGTYMRGVGHHGWPVVLAVAIVVPVVAFVVFEQWFLVPMPKGPLEAWLGY